MNAPKITATDLKVAATRLLGTVVHDVAGVVSGPAVYLPRLAVFASVDDTDKVLGDDDGTLIDLLDGTPARDLIAQHGTASAAAKALNARVRAAWSA
jgi:hypothetical protein